MQRKLTVILSLLVLLPLALMAWQSKRLAEQEQLAVKERIQREVAARLSVTRGTIREKLEVTAVELLRIGDDLRTDKESLRSLVRSHPLVENVLLLDREGEILFPPPDEPVSDREEVFLIRLQKIPEDRVLIRKTRPIGELGRTPEAESGWYTFYWQQGLSFLFWQGVSEQRVLIFEVSRARLLASIVAALPDSVVAAPPDSVSSDQRGWPERIALTMADGSALYQWGDFESQPGQIPVASLALDPPLQSWHLLHFAPDETLAAIGGPKANLSLIMIFVAVGAVLIGLVSYLYREYMREVRLARQRVSFVNQVSHELKTPLTNIRMYAELLEGRIPEEDGKSLKYMSIIVGEARRLSRMISNVLTFARKQRNKLTLHTKPAIVDEIVEYCLEQCRPGLSSKGVRIEFSPAAPAMVKIDSDCLEQLLLNLFSNVEKYGAEGGLMDVSSWQDGECTTIQVSDRGPGIPTELGAAIFQPFTRLSSKASDGVAGTGIGLTIARELARLHGGELELVPTEEGACFELTLATGGYNPRQEGGGR